MNKPLNAVTLLALLDLVASCAGMRVPVTSESVRYLIDATQPSSGALRVTVEMPSTLRGKAFSFYFRNIDAAAFTEVSAVIDGQPVAPKAGSLHGNPRFSFPPFGESAVVRYRVAPLSFGPGADGDPAKAICKLDDVGGMLRTMNVLGVPSFRAPLSLRFELPQGWSAIAPWPEDDDGFRAGPDWPEQIEFIGIGPYEVRQARVGSCTLSIGITEGLKGVSAQMVGLLLEQLLSWFGPPTGDATYSAFVVPQAYLNGGMSGTRSLVTTDDPIPLTHELVHWWTTHDRIPDDAVWFREGVTEYAGIVYAGRAGLIAPQYETECFADLFGELRLLEGAGYLSLPAAYRRQDDRRLDRLVYTKGALFAFWAEQQLGPMGRSVDELIAAVLSSPRRGLGTAKIRVMARELFGPVLDAGFDAYILGSEPLPDLGLPAPTWTTGLTFFRPGEL